MNSKTSQVRPSATLLQLKESLFSKISDLTLASELFENIQAWTSGQPVLTRVLYQRVIHHFTQPKSKPSAQSPREALRPETAQSWVERIVEEDILRNWAFNQAGTHLRELSRTLLAYEPKDTLLITYWQILQRGSKIARSTPEQETLLRCGLVTLEGAHLQVANEIYARIFDKQWLEQQIPGLTKPVSVFSNSSEIVRPSSASKLYSKLTVIACGLLVAGAVAYQFFQAPNGAEVIPLPSQESASFSGGGYEPAGPPRGQENFAKNTDSKLLSRSRDRFDLGIDHATNGRWLPMLREFCQIPTHSTYYLPAQRQLYRWRELYAADIQLANEALANETSRACPLVEEMRAN